MPSGCPLLTPSRTTVRLRALPEVQAWLRRVKESQPTQKACRARQGIRLRASKAQATPVWADKEAIARVYALRDQATLTTGTPHDVDHIVPLNHPLVSGLHVPANLEVIPAAANRLKSNRWWPDMP